MKQRTHKLSQFNRPWRSSARMLTMLLSPTTVVFAHPGHEHEIIPPNQPAHWLLEPQHAAIWIGAAMVAWTVVKAMRTFAAPRLSPREIQR